MTALLVALGAALGAPLRFVLAHLIDRDGRHRGTLLANLLGSFLLGLFAALSLDGGAYALLGTGFCGAFTTYSSFAVQTHGRGRLGGAVYAAGTIVGALAACTLGFWVAQA